MWRRRRRGDIRGRSGFWFEEVSLRDSISLANSKITQMPLAIQILDLFLSYTDTIAPTSFNFDFKSLPRSVSP